MQLRQIELSDAPRMLEWMRDDNVISYLNPDRFKGKALSDCENFILNSQKGSKSLNLAISDDEDLYMGTVSLKNIDWDAGDAEFAIAMRTEAMGTGLAHFAMNEMMKKGIHELQLKNIYWSVRIDNMRAIRFYDKSGYRRYNPLVDWGMPDYRPSAACLDFLGGGTTTFSITFIQNENISNKSGCVTFRERSVA